ncbi:uncharacterized protein LOC129273602 [Lytechinus pictus]|uniref:uncharacterized protein LOC129273602 n=1 Tax=Lytechinus pictus TaxID=7653 RepID=UPI0030B9D5FD
MDSRSFVELNPTWNTQGPYDIHVCLNCNFENEENGSQDETRSSGSVIILSNSDQSSPKPCMLQISCKPGAELLAISVVSNARHAEVNDNTDGYLSTARGQRLEPEAREGDDDDVMYKKEIKLDRSYNSVKLKFVSLADKNLLHLHHIKLTLTRSNGSRETPLQDRHGNINMDHVRGLLASQQPISDKAESLMNTIEQYQKNQSSVVQDLQAAVVGAAANQKSASSDLGMMGQMASLLSGFSRSGAQGQMAASPDVMLKMMSSFEGGGGDSPGKESMYGALKMMCRGVTNMRLQEEEDANNKDKQDKEKCDEEEKNDEPSASQTSLGNHLESFLADMEAKMMSRLDAKLDAIQTHFDLRFNKLETMLSELTAHTVNKGEPDAKVNGMTETKPAAKEQDPRANLYKYL